jgi:peptidyl-dipeptidase Dcp
MNHLSQPWTGPFGGVPPFNHVTVHELKEALEEAIADKLKKVGTIADQNEPPTFENTLEALEESGVMLTRLMALYGVFSNNLSTPEFQKMEVEMAPKLAAVKDKIIQNPKLFHRIDSIYNSPEKHKLSDEQQRLVWLYYQIFARAGARLDEEGKQKLSLINQRLATLFTKFSQNILADEAHECVIIDDSAGLVGLSNSIVSAAAEEASRRGLSGKWVISNTRSSVDPVLTYAANRTLRERVWRMFINRGDNQNEFNNNSLITEILALRRERATLLGYESHAHWTLENSMAKTPEKAMELLHATWKPALETVREEVMAMEDIARAEGQQITIQPWDYKFYMEKVRKKRFDLDQNDVKPYLQLDNLKEAMFYVAGELFNLSFSLLKDVPVFHEDVMVYEVRGTDNNKHVGLFYFDPYARNGKRSGAWMTSYRLQQKFRGSVTPIVSNNSNFVKAKPGEPVLISWDDATTLFHEFGHALHSLLSAVAYPTLAGTNVFRDYVEFPSQLLEHWLMTREVLQKFALHCETNEPIPDGLVRKLEEASTFNQGFATTEYLASALMDMHLHLSPEIVNHPASFEKDTLKSLGMPAQIVMRHRTPQFLHIFSSDSYAAGYYSYLWADVLTADGFEAFIEGNGPYDKSVAQKLRTHVLSAGNTRDPQEAFRAFRGKDAAVEALMVKRGFRKKAGSA